MHPVHTPPIAPALGVAPQRRQASIELDFSYADESQFPVAPASLSSLSGALEQRQCQIVTLKIRALVDKASRSFRDFLAMSQKSRRFSDRSRVNSLLGWEGTFGTVLASVRVSLRPRGKLSVCRYVDRPANQPPEANKTKNNEITNSFLEETGG